MPRGTRCGRAWLLGVVLPQVVYGSKSSVAGAEALSPLGLFPLSRFKASLEPNRTEDPAAQKRLGGPFQLPLLQKTAAVSSTSKQTFAGHCTCCAPQGPVVHSQNRVQFIQQFTPPASYRERPGQRSLNRVLHNSTLNVTVSTRCMRVRLHTIPLTAVETAAI